MTTSLENILARKATIIQELANLNHCSIGGRPNMQIEGAIDHQSYKRGLYDELRNINELITSIEGPWEVVST